MTSPYDFKTVGRDARSRNAPSSIDETLYDRPSSSRGERRSEFSTDFARPPYVRHSSTQQSSQFAARSHGRLEPSRRQSWPRYTTVEEEKISLAKEAFPFKADSDRVEASCRGSIDQTPIILETEELQKQYTSNKAHEKTRRDPSLRVSTHDQDASTQPRVKAKRVQILDTPEDLTKKTERVDFAERHATPYLFTPKHESKASPTDSGYSSSTDVLAEKRKQARAGVDDARSDALRGQGRARGSNHTRQPSSLSYDGEGTRKCFAETPSSPLEARASREAHNRPRLAEIKADTLRSVRRGSDTAASLPRPRVFSERVSQTSMPSKPPPVATLATANSSTDRASTTRSATSSRSGTPEPVLPSTPRSSRMENDRTLEEGRSSRAPGKSSLPSSQRSSRASSPVDGVQRSSTFPISDDDRSYKHSRSSNSISSMDECRPRDAYCSYRPLAPPSALPYPVDDMGLMPSEKDHRYRPRLQDGVSMPSIPAHRLGQISSTTRGRLDPLIMPSFPVTLSGPPSPATEKRFPDAGHMFRPRLPPRHTADGAIPTLKTSPPSTPTASYMSGPFSARAFTSDTVTAKAPVAREPRGLPPCPRSTSSRGYDDWLTLDGLPNFDICPSCYAAVFAPTSFFIYFKSAKPKDPRDKTRCDFASAWIRLAWLMTQQQSRRDLSLIYGVARIGVSDSCPGSTDECRTWYTLMDRKGSKIDKFDVCRADVHRIEVLMPQLRSTFVRAYHGEQKTRKCDLRVQSRRFEQYLNRLSDITQRAETENRAPNVQAFVDYAKQRSQLRECCNDEPLRGKSWFFIPQLPEFTVCEECYADVVWPRIDKGSLLANRFLRTPQPVTPNRDEARSCQLYSDRMRKYFIEYCEDEDYDKLRHKALERRRAETHTRSWERSIRKDIKAIRDEHPNADVEGLRIQLQRVRDDWAKFE